MNKRILSVFLILLAAVIVTIVARDLLVRNPGRSPRNPYELDIDTFMRVDPSLISFREFRQIRLNLAEPAGIALVNDRIFLVGDQKLLVISGDGLLLSEHALPYKASCITPMEEDLLAIGLRDRFGIYRQDGTMQVESEVHSNSSVFTAIACRDGRLFIADAGNRRVLVYDEEGNFKREFKGETGDGTSHGFLVPSPNFHLDFDPSGRLWVTNPGIHSLQQYDLQGHLVTG